MFKKLFIASAVLLASSTSALAFSGAYVGADIGGNYALFKDRVNDGSTSRFGGLGSMFDVFAGYGTMVNQRVYLGGEVSASGLSSKVKGVEYSTNYGDASTRFDTNYSYGASVIPGLLLNDTTMAYARVGVVRTGFNVKSSTPVGSDSDKKISTGGQAGLGLQTAISPKLDLRGEYDFTSYHSFSVGSDDNNNKISPTSGQVKVGLVYRLD